MVRNVLSWVFAIAAAYPTYLITEPVRGTVMEWVVFGVCALLVGFIATIIYPPTPVHFGPWQREP